MEQKDRWGYVCKLCSCQPIVVGESGWLNVKFRKQTVHSISLAMTWNHPTGTAIHHLKPHN